jgi:tRNA threonylcarbamoyladenosine biosynthesis protein TsaB
VNILAIELSSRRGSLAVLSNAAVLAEGELTEEDRKSRGLFRLLPDLCRQAGVSLEEFDLLAPGRGPGAYTGLRIAMTVAQALALPGHRPVYPVSSGEALAWEIMQDRKAGLVAVLGDARRGTLWVGLFEQVSDGPRIRLPWAVATPDEAARLVPDEAVVVSSEWSLLSVRPEFEPLRSARWIAEDCYPRARWVGDLAWDRFSSGAASEPPSPLYTHPPVNPKAPDHS